MIRSHLAIIAVLVLSVGIQTWAAVAAMHLIRVTGRRTAWSLIAAALGLMAVRRIVPLYRLLTGDISHPPDVMNEVVGLSLSLVMAVGISRIAPLFLERKRAEEEARRAAAEIEDLYEHAPCGYHSVNSDGVIIRMNNTELQGLGYAKEEIAGNKKISDIMTPGSRDAFKAAFAKLREQGFVKDVEVEFVRKNGTILPALVSATAIYDDAGSFLMSRTTVYDITERRRMEEAFRTNELKYRIVADNTYDWEFWQTPDGRFEYFSPSCERITGRAAREFLQDPALLRNIVHPDDRSLFDRHLSERLDQKKIGEMEFRVVRSDGTIRWIEHVCQPVFDADGVFLGRRSSNRDSTERHRAEEVLHERELHSQSLLRLSRKMELAQTYTQALEAARDEVKIILGYHRLWVYLVSEDEEYAYSLVTGGSAPETILSEKGTARLRIKGDRLLEEIAGAKDIIVVEDARTDERTSKEIVAKMDNRTIVNVPIIFLDNHLGSVGMGTFGDEGVRVPSESGKDYLRALASHMAVTFDRIHLLEQRADAEERLRVLNRELDDRVRERTALLQRRTEELEQANERLKEVDRAKSAFLDSMNHEFRTPLNSIIGFSSILLNEWTGPVSAEQKRNLESILRSGRHLLNMITDVLDVTQMEAEAIKPAVEEFELYELLAEAQKAVSAAVRKKGIELRSESCRHRMRTDRQRLLQCVLNMLYNAVKFTDAGCVTVSSRVVASSGDLPEAETAEIVVADTGIGISEENQAKLFKPFSRLITPQRVIVPGTGLGLFLTRKIARDILKGDCFVSSVQGKGSRFTLRIPVGLA